MKIIYSAGSHNILIDKLQNRTTMKCPHCSQNSLSLTQMIVFFNAKCDSCDRFIVIKSAVGLKYFILYGFILGILLAIFVENDFYRFFLFILAGGILSFGHLRFGELQVAEER